MKVLLTGATGYLGSEILTLLLQQERVEVIYCFTRRRIISVDHPKIRLIAVEDIAKVEKIPDIDVIINSAGEKVDERKMSHTNIDGAVNLFRLANGTSTHTFVQISSVGSYGASRFSGRISEASEQHPQGMYETSKSLAEKALTLSPRRSGLRLVIAQPSNIIDSRNSAPQALPGLVSMLKHGYAPKIQSADGWLNFVSTEQVALKIWTLISNPEIGGRVIINCPIKYSAALKTMANALRRNLLIVPVPKTLELLFKSTLKIIPADGPFLARMRNRLFEMHNDRYFESDTPPARFTTVEIESLYESVARQRMLKND